MYYQLFFLLVVIFHVYSVTGRVICERSFPYRCYIYAGGFDENGSMQVPQERVIIKSKPLDGVSRYGLYMWSPARKDWAEISVLGYTVLYSAPFITYVHSSYEIYILTETRTPQELLNLVVNILILTVLKFHGRASVRLQVVL